MTTARKLTTGLLVQQLSDQDVQNAITSFQDGDQKDRSRLFLSLPDSFDCLLADVAAYQAELIQILRQVECVRDEEDFATAFVYSEDEEAVKRWALSIIHHGRRVLLTSNQEIRPRILELTQNTPETLSSHDIVFSFLTAVTQHIIVDTGLRCQEYQIHESAFLAFTKSMRLATYWLDDALGLETPDIAMVRRVKLESLHVGEPKPKQEAPFSFRFAFTVGAGLLFAAGYLLTTRSQGLNPDGGNNNNYTPN